MSPEIDRRLRVAFCCNTRHEEDEFQVEYEPPSTIEKVKRGIEEAGYEYIFLEADENAYDKLRRTRPDLVLNRAEGIRGESRESHIPAFCEMLGIPYVGSGIMSTAICLDKPTTKKILEFHGVATAPFQTFRMAEDLIEDNLRLPLILKPSHEGSSMGVNWDNVVFDEPALRRKLGEMLSVYRQQILGEQFIDGREFTTGIIGNREQVNDLTFLPVLEVDFSGFPEELGNVLGQKAKTIFDSSSNYVCPARISEELRSRLEGLTLKAYDVLDIKDWARFDWRMDSEGEIYFLEVNPLPGIDYDEEKDELSFYPMMCRAAGMSFSGMVKRVIESASRRYGLM